MTNPRDVLNETGFDILKIPDQANKEFIAKMKQF